MLLRLHPKYPWQDYIQDHEKILEALRRRDPSTPSLVSEHLRLSARLIREGISRDGDQAGTPASAGSSA